MTDNTQYDPRDGAVTVAVLRAHSNNDEKPVQKEAILDVTSEYPALTDDFVADALDRLVDNGRIGHVQEGYIPEPQTEQTESNDGLEHSGINIRGIKDARED